MIYPILSMYYHIMPLFQTSQDRLRPFAASAARNCTWPWPWAAALRPGKSVLFSGTGSIFWTISTINPTWIQSTVWRSTKHIEHFFGIKIHHVHPRALCTLSILDKYDIRWQSSAARARFTATGSTCTRGSMGSIGSMGMVKAGQSKPIGLSKRS